MTTFDDPDFCCCNFCSQQLFSGRLPSGGHSKEKWIRFKTIHQYLKLAMMRAELKEKK